MFPIRDTEPVRRSPSVVPALIGLCLAVFVFELSLDEPAMNAFFARFALRPDRYVDLSLAEWFEPSALWPFVTHMFLHASPVHALGNLWTLWIFGDNVEEKLGGFRFLAFYLVCGLCAAALQLATSWGSELPMVGASGAIAGVMGAYLLLCPRSQIVLLLFPWPFLVAIPAVLYLGYWALLQGLGGAVSLRDPDEGGVAWFAHLGGFGAGLLLHRLFRRPPRGTPRREPA